VRWFFHFCPLDHVKKGDLGSESLVLVENLPRKAQFYVYRRILLIHLYAL